jgi:hypothetical protein
MNPDPVIQEVREAKESVAAEYGHDIRTLMEDLMHRQKEFGERLVSLPPRKTEAA